MQSLLFPESDYSEADVEKALRYGFGATRQMRVRYEHLDKLNNSLGYLENIVMDGEVNYQAFADIPGTAKFSIRDTGTINFLADRIRPWMGVVMPDTSVLWWPQGLYLLSSPVRSKTATAVTRDIEAYDQTKVLIDESSNGLTFVTSGTKYTDAVSTLLGSMAKNITPSSKTLPSTMQWEPGTTKLKRIQDLLAAINYEPLHFSPMGVAIVQPYVSPADSPDEFVYADNEVSVNHHEMDQKLDDFNIPNQWTLVYSDADQATPLIATYTNTNPSSPTSTISRGRTISDFRTEQEAADLTTLQQKAQRLAFEASQVYESVEFSTATMPIHAHGDVYTVRDSGLLVDASYRETEWTLPLLESGGSMKHVARRIVNVG